MTEFVSFSVLSVHVTVQSNLVAVLMLHGIDEMFNFEKHTNVRFIL